MNKGIKIGIGVVAVGGIATAIALPIALHKDNKPEEIDMSQEAWNGETLQQLVDKVKHEQQTSSSIITESMKAIAFIKYDEEQKGSLKMQAISFRWEIFKLNKEKTKLETEKSGLDTNKDVNRIDTIDKRISDIATSISKYEDKIDKVLNNKLTKADYEDSDFSINYPEVLMLESIIEERQKSIVEDQKTLYIDQFSTKPEGTKSWTEELDKKYNGATSIEEAATYLTYGIIKDGSLASYKYKINSAYTYEQKNATYDDGGTAKPIFPFLQNAHVKSGSQEDDDLVYFISTESKNPDKLEADVDAIIGAKAAAGKPGYGLARLPLTRLSHTLIGAIQNENGAALPWNITKEVLIGTPDAQGDQAKYGLLSTFGSTQQSFFELLTDYTTATDGTVTEHEKTFIQYAAQNSAGTANKGGFLSVKPTLDTLGGMVPGFVIGGIEGLSHNTSGETGDGKDVIKKIVDGLNTWKSTESVNTNDEIIQKINSMSEEDVTQTFGSIFRDAFGSKPEITYQIDAFRFITLSKFGIHIVNHQEYRTEQDIKAQITKDLTTAADEQETKNVEFNYTELFGLIATDDDIVREVLANNEKSLSDNYGSANGKGIIKQLKEDGTEMNWAEVKKLITDTIKSKEDARILESTSTVVGDAVETYLEDKYNKDLLSYELNIKTDYTNAAAPVTVDAGQIYKDAAHLAGGSI